MTCRGIRKKILGLILLLAAWPFVLHMRQLQNDTRCVGSSCAGNRPVENPQGISSTANKFIQHRSPDHVKIHRPDISNSNHAISQRNDSKAETAQSVDGHRLMHMVETKRVTVIRSKGLGQTDKAGVDHYDALRAMELRAAEVRSKCMDQHSNYLAEELKSNTVYKTITTARSRDFIYHPIAKCGWSSWVYILFANAGKADMPDKDDFIWGWDSPYDEAGMRVVQTFRYNKLELFDKRIVFVRHPYERLISAYVDKALDKKYTHIVKRPCKQITEDSPVLPFPAFIDCMLQNAWASLARMRVKDLSSPKVARSIDLHWTSQFWSSLPCSLNYTHIGHAEHMAEDMQAAINLLGLKTVPFHKNKHKSNYTTDLKYWFDQLSQDQKQSLQQMYKYDFEVFGFDNTLP